MEIKTSDCTTELILKYQVEDKLGIKNFQKGLTRWRPKPIKLYDRQEKIDKAWFPITASIKGKAIKKVEHKGFNSCKKMYPEQQEAFDAIIRESNKNLCCIGKLPTGFGKSVILSYLVDFYKAKTMIILPNNTLLKQIKDTLEEFGLTVSVYGGGKKDIGDITVMSARGLSMMTDEELHNLDFDLIICDEVHNMMAIGVRRALVHLNPAIQVGLSGTPWCANFGEEEMQLFFGKILAFGETPLEPEFRIINYNNGSYENTVKNWTDFREELDDDQDRLICQRLAIGNIMKEFDTVLVLYDRIEKHVIPQYEALKKLKGVNVVMLHGKMKKKDREEAIQSLKEKGGIMVGSAAIAREGFDVPRIEAVCNFYPQKFDKNTIQATGRALRKYGDKEVGVCYDWQESALVHQSRARNRTYMEKFPNSKIT